MKTYENLILAMENHKYYCHIKFFIKGLQEIISSSYNKLFILELKAQIGL